jgi:hypothetical protein
MTQHHLTTLFQSATPPKQGPVPRAVFCRDEDISGITFYDGPYTPTQSHVIHTFNPGDNAVRTQDIRRAADAELTNLWFRKSRLLVQFNKHCLCFGSQIMAQSTCTFTKMTGRRLIGRFKNCLLKDNAKDQFLLYIGIINHPNVHQHYLPSWIQHWSYLSWVSVDDCNGQTCTGSAQYQDCPI